MNYLTDKKNIIFTATLIFTLAVITYSLLPSQKKSLNINIRKAEDNFLRITTESNFVKQRTAFFNLDRVLLTESDTKTLFSMAKNALILQDPEGLEVIAKRLKSLNSLNNVEKSTIEMFQIKASELLSTRARVKRFEAHRIAAAIQKIEVELDSNPKKPDQKTELEILQKTYNLLLEEFPKDAEKASELDNNNARALYDLARFMQDKPGLYDKRVAIKNFEKVVELLTHKAEKDADFLRANLNLAVLYFEIGNEPKARCYSSQTIKKSIAKNQDEYNYLLGKQENGQFNEPEFMKVIEKLNPKTEMVHPDCRKLADF